MNNAKLFVIEYTLHGAPKSFIIRSGQNGQCRGLALGELRRRRGPHPALWPGKSAKDQQTDGGKIRRGKRHVATDQLTHTWQAARFGGNAHDMTLISSPAHLDYGLDTLFGRITKSVECRVGLEAVEDDPYLLRTRVSAAAAGRSRAGENRGGPGRRTTAAGHRAPYRTAG